MLGYWEWLDGLERGLAAHHAGMLPAFKEVVEELFVRGLVKAVFATETLALGINMPARCVVLERLVKFNGEAHVDLTPGEYTQLTGRAGRRGIDVEGHAVVVWSPEVDPRHVAGLASTRTYPLRSSFRPSYNMAVNLVGTVGADARPRAAGVVVRPVPGGPVGGRPGPAGAAQRRDHRRVRRRGGLPPRRLRRVLRAPGGASPTGSARWPGRAPRSAGPRRSTSLERLRVGDVIRVPSGRRAGLAVVLDPGAGGFGEPRPLVLTEDRWAGRISAGRLRRAGGGAGPGPGAEALQPPLAAGAARPGRRGQRQPALDRHGARGGRPAPRRQPARTTSCSRCASAAAPAPVPRLPGAGGARPLGRARGTGWSATPRRCGTRWPSRTGSLARTFDQVCALLADRGYLAGDGEVTDAGRMLARIWTEADLLVAECLRRGVWDGLAPAELAAAVSVVLYESRREGDERASVPRGPGRRRGRRDAEALGRARGRRGRRTGWR